MALHSAQEPEVPKLWCCGLIASPAFPPSMLAKGRTKPGKVAPPGFHDTLSGMRIHQSPCGQQLRLESFY